MYVHILVNTARPRKHTRWISNCTHAYAQECVRSEVRASSANTTYLQWQRRRSAPSNKHASACAGYAHVRLAYSTKAADRISLSPGLMKTVIPLLVWLPLINRILSPLSCSCIIYASNCPCQVNQSHANLHCCCSSASIV